MTAVLPACVKKIGEFLCSHFNIEDGRKKQHFLHIMLYYFKKCKNTIEMQKKKDLCSVWRRCCDQSNMSKVMVKFRVRDFFFAG